MGESSLKISENKDPWLMLVSNQGGGGGQQNRPRLNGINEDFRLDNAIFCFMLF